GVSRPPHDAPPLPAAPARRVAAQPALRHVTSPMAAARIIDNRTARRLLLQRQGLSFPPHRKLSDSDLLALIEHLGFVQVDSIQTVERAHHMILFARNQTYRHQQLKRLHERDGLLFESWTHDAS